MNPQQRKQQNLTAIYQALLQLMTDKPMANIAITELCQKAHVSRTYFYRNYHSFDDIILAFQEQNMLNYLRHLPNANKIDLPALMTHYFELTESEIETSKLLIRNGKMTVLIETFQTVFRLLIKQHRIDNRTYAIFDQPYYLEFFSGAVVNVAADWIARGTPEPPHYLAQQINRFANRH